MIRADMISTVGREYLASNIENDEYSYPKAFAAQSLTFNPIRNKAGRAFEKLDIRFVKYNVTVLIETKQNFTKADEEQLSAYVEYEKTLTGNKTVAILANTMNDTVRVCQKQKYYGKFFRSSFGNATFMWTIGLWVQIHVT